MQKPGKKNKKLSSAVSNERMTGVWVDLVLDDGRVLNNMLRQTIEDALNGDEKSLRIVLRVFDVNRAAFERQQKDGWHETLLAERPVPTPGKTADIAMLILGIAVIDNSTLRKEGAMDDPDSEDIAQKLKPTHLAPWVRDFAVSRSDASRCRAEREPHSAFLAEGDPDAGDWNEVKGRVILARLRRSGRGRAFPQGSVRKQAGQATVPLPRRAITRAALCRVFAGAGQLARAGGHGGAGHKARRLDDPRDQESSHRGTEIA